MMPVFDPDGSFLGCTDHETSLCPATPDGKHKWVTTGRGCPDGCCEDYRCHLCKDVARIEVPE